MRSISPLLCLATMLLSYVTCQIIGCSTCPCLKTSDTVLRLENITNYKRHTAGVCHIDAIEFKTVKGFTVCSNPQKPWVRRAMKFVDKKRKANEMTARPINSTLPFKTASTQNTTSRGWTTNHMS
ncbi:chemokine (C-X-C motif) ligand 32b, duplicate 1 [Myxocyprinus asiaticus]|uniref:chemokine (C-X-C motif) ligand 32b, duplicate 1 n=1 Tax=Myxocyprinus asiaticus TaxID=70543 RepID=UPI002221AAFD|nr:chemokine (C-X-C motif) ligand 32b, duplicate 1 [Myxocyprinus asiaticus]